MEKVYFKTFGCRTNIYDTELLKGYIKDFELANDENTADVVVVNSCTVTNGADSGTRAYIKALRERGLRVILTGCGAVSRGRELFEQKAVFGVLGGANKHKINDLLLSKREFFELGDLNFSEKAHVKGYETHTKAFVKIQEGCDFECSYCIIPAVRGKSRSTNADSIAHEVAAMAENGYSEFVLTGTNIGSYGLKEGTSLAKLLKKLALIKGVRRIRLGSLEPSQIDAEFMELLGEKWLEKHLHIALQHTSEKMLRIMRRRNRLWRDIKLFESLAARGFALGTDFIVAHPGETEEIWREAVANFRHFALTHIHAFIYSPRFGTHSASMKCDITGDVARARLNFLKQIVAENNLKFRQNLAQNKLPLCVLVESKKGEFYEGWDEFYNKIRIKSSKDLRKQWLNIDKYAVCDKFNAAEV